VADALVAAERPRRGDKSPLCEDVNACFCQLLRRKQPSSGRGLRRRSAQSQELSEVDVYVATGGAKQRA
jgi:hypothetical protein